MQKLFTFLTLGFLAELIFFGFEPDFVSAQNPEEKIGIAVNQSVFTFDLAPGETKEFALNIKNISEEEEQLSAETQDFAIGEQNEIIFLAGRNEMNGLSDWLQTDAANWFLAPGAEKEIKITLAVPSDATPGSHFSMLALRALPKIDGTNWERPIVSGRIAVEILANVAGQVSGQGKLLSFQAPLIADKEIDFKAEFQNEGNAHYVPCGEVVVKDLIFRKESKIEMPRHFVFPGKKYTFENKWLVGSALGIYLAKASFVDGEKITHSSSRIILGRYFFLTLIVILGIIIILFKFFRRLRKINAPIENTKQN